MSVRLRVVVRWRLSTFHTRLGSRKDEYWLLNNNSVIMYAIFPLFLTLDYCFRQENGFYVRFSSFLRRGKMSFISRMHLRRFPICHWIEDRIYVDLGLTKMIRMLLRDCATSQRSHETLPHIANKEEITSSILTTRRKV